MELPREEIEFLSRFSVSNVEVLSPDPQVGPDGWPYLMVQTSESGSGEPVQKILNWLSEKGIGLVLNPTKDYPDYVWTYGMVWNHRERGEFYTVLSSKTLRTDLNEPKELSAKDFVESGIPSRSFLPDYVRKVLRDFFRDQAVLQPRISMLRKADSEFELAFSWESLGKPPQSEWSGILEAISWFLPSHYQILLISEAGLPPFVGLGSDS